MENKSHLEAAKLLQTQLVHYLSFMKTQVYPRLQTKQDTVARHNIGSLFLRALLWGEALEKLDSAKYFQTSASATRSLLEICVDILLLNRADLETAHKYEVWKESAILSYAASVVNFFRSEVKKQIPEEFKHAVKFYDSNVKRIKEERILVWGKEDHPPRWMGWTDMRKDCKEIDYVYPALSYENTSLEEWWNSLRRITGGYCGGHMGIRWLELKAWTTRRFMRMP